MDSKNWLQEFVFESLLIFVQVRPCLDLVILSSLFHVMPPTVGQITKISLEFQSILFWNIGPALSRSNSVIGSAQTAKAKAKATGYLGGIYFTLICVATVCGHVQVAPVLWERGMARINGAMLAAKCKSTRSALSLAIDNAVSNHWEHFRLVVCQTPKKFTREVSCQEECKLRE